MSLEVRLLDPGVQNNNNTIKNSRDSTGTGTSQPACIAFEIFALDAPVPASTCHLSFIFTVD